MKSSRDMLSESVAFAKAHWLKIVLFNLAAAVLGGIFEYGFPSLSSVLANTSSGAALGTALFALSILILIVGIAGAIYMRVASNVLNPYLISSYDAGSSPSAKEVLVACSKKALPLVWVTFLSGLVIFAGLAALLIPGLYFAVMLAFAQYAMVVDGKKSMSALAYSYGLVKGRFWKVIGKSLYPMIYFLALVAVFAILGFAAYKLGTVMLAIVSIAAAVALVAFAIVSISYAYKLYRELSRTVDHHHEGLAKSSVRLKVWAWVGFALLVVSFAVGTAFFMRSGLNLDEVLERANGQQGQGSMEEIFGEVGSWSGEGISFAYPGSFIEVPPADAETYATFASLSGGMLTIYIYDVSGGLENTPAELLAADFDSLKSMGSIETYDLSKESFEGYEVAVASAYLDAEGQTAYVKSAVIVSGEKIYLLNGLSAVEGAGEIDSAFDTVLESVELY